MANYRATRRAVLGAGAALGVGAPLAGLTAGSAHADPGQFRRGPARTSLRSAVTFLQAVTDAHESSGPRLAQSYQDNSGLTDIAFVYDNALTIIALLSAGDTARARSIADALIYAQDHDEKFTDGRLRQAYHADSFLNPDRTAHFGWEFGLVGTAVGDMSWAGIALAHLAAKTGRRDYLAATLRIGQWIFDKTYSTSGLGGYTFGETAGLEGHKSSEHNIDVYAYFRMLARLTGREEWRSRADHAWAFVEKVWNAEAGFFYTGSDDGATVNTKATQLPLDVQTWSWLAARQPAYASALDWAATHLASTDTPLRRNSALTGNLSVSGVAFGSGSLLTDTSAKIGGHEWNPKPDDAAVWFEGTGQLALALANRGRGADADAAGHLMDEIRKAQRRLGAGQTFGGKPAPGGIVAASSPMDTGFGFGYFPNLHIGATAWFVMAAAGLNPYRLP